MLSPTFEVNGKTVTLRERFPLEEFFNLPALADQIDLKDARTAIPLLAAVVESWSFDGDPGDYDSYVGMDAVTEFLPMLNYVSQYVNREVAPRTEERLKN